MNSLFWDSGYDLLGRMIGEEQGAQGAGDLPGTGSDDVAQKKATFSYNKLGEMTGISRYSNLSGGSTYLVGTTAYSYDNAERLTGITHHNAGSGTIDAFSFNYDADSNIVSMNRSGTVFSLGYDNNNQLTGTTITSGTGTAESYTYDASGNRTAQTTVAYNSSGNTINADNQLANDGTYSYTYDAEGNLIGRHRLSNTGNDDYVVYTYDYRNRLVQVENQNSSHTLKQDVYYVYSPATNQRLNKVVDDEFGTPTLEELYAYGPDGHLLETMSANESGSVIERYLTGPDGNVIAEEEDDGDSAGTVYWALEDQVGSVTDVLNNAGAVKDHIVYDSFGNIASQTDGSYSIRFGYAGMITDNETGLYYDNARYYNPTTGTFDTQDPIGFGGGDYNLHRYVGNSPIDHIDPSGTRIAPGYTADPEQVGLPASVAAEQARTELLSRIALAGNQLARDEDAARTERNNLERRAGRHLSASLYDSCFTVTIVSQDILDKLYIRIHKDAEAYKRLEKLYNELRSNDHSIPDFYHAGLDAYQKSLPPMTGDQLRQMDEGGGLSSPGLDPVTIGVSLAAGPLLAAGDALIGTFGSAAEGALPAAIATETEGGAATSFEQFVANRTFGSQAEAHEAWEAYQRAATAGKGILIGHGDAPVYAQCAGWNAFRTLNWTPAVNDAFIDGALDAGLPIKLITPFDQLLFVSPRTGELTVTWDEILRIVSNGGTLIGG